MHPLFYFLQGPVWLSLLFESQLHFIPMSRQQKTSSSSEKQDNGHPHRWRDPHHPHLIKWALLGQRKEHNTFTSSSKSVCGQKTLISENRPLPSLMKQKQPGSLLYLSGKHTSYTPKTNLLYVVTKLVNEKTCYVLCPTHQVPTPSSSILSSIKAVAWIHQQPSLPANQSISAGYTAAVWRREETDLSGNWSPVDFLKLEVGFGLVEEQWR